MLWRDRYVVLLASVAEDGMPGIVDDRDGWWVVGVDGSDESAAALDWAIVHAAGRAVGLRLVTAWHAPMYGPYPIDGAMTQPYDDKALMAAVRADLDERVAATVERVELPVEGAVTEGGTTSSLLSAADGTGMLVLGNRGRGGFSRLLLGSTSSQCAAHATVPTTVVRGEGSHDPAERLLVGVDGSPNSLAALEWAVHFADPGSTVRAVWVWDTSPLAVGADEFFFPEASTIANERFEHMVRQHVELAEERSVTLRRSFLHGRPRTVLADEASGADLVVTGARGQGAIGGALLGSVTTWLLHHLDRPQVVVPGDIPGVLGRSSR